LNRVQCFGQETILPPGRLQIQPLVARSSTGTTPVLARKGFTMRSHLRFLPLTLSILLSLGTQAFAQDLSGAGGAPAATRTQLISDWFNRYDGIRRGAQMAPAERAKADAAMAKGLMVAPEDKPVVQAFLKKLISKDSTAAEQLKGLPLYPETEQLHKGYYQYFTQAAKSFGESIAVQNNMFAVDEKGESVAKNLILHKQELETLDRNNKDLDARLRQQFNIAPYHYP
jgi:hypothetical protein